MIDLTPLEVRKKKGDFRRAMRGYDPLLVDDFLDLVADRLEELVRENMALMERINRQEQQVSDYRDREKALTEALVSAQEMREEVRRQATREAELSKQSAEHHAAQLRAQVEDESRRLRAEAQQEAAQLKATVQNQREREEDLLRHLTARREEFVASYRAVLERELSELSVLSRALGVHPGRGSSAEPVRAPESIPEPPDAPRQGSPSTTPQEPPAARTTKAEGTTEGRGAMEAAGGGTAAQPPRPVAEPVEQAEPPMEELADELLESDVADEAALAMGATPGPLLEFEAEPFEPEPFLPEPFDAAGFAGDDVADAYQAEGSTEEAGATDATEVSGDGAEARLYDGIAADESGDGVPGPIGLGEAATEPWQGPWAVTPTPVDDVFDLGEAELLGSDDDDDDDPDTAALLRNAAAAGYRLSDDDIPDEILLDETTSGSVDETPEDDGWLPNLLDDDKD